MIVDAFLEWTANAPVERRVEATDALARAYLYSPVTDEERRKLTTGLFALLDDASVRVRERLADVFADRSDAPRAVLFRLIDDVPSVCATLFARSPLLLDQHLIDGLSRGEPKLSMAIAERMTLGERVVDTLVDQAGLHACLTLLANPYVRLSHGQVDRYIARFGADAEALDRLMEYRQISIDQRCRLIASRTGGLMENSFVQALVPQRRLERLARAAQDRALVGALEEGSTHDVLTGLRHLYEAGHITQAFLLRVALGGHMPVLEGAVAVLAGTAVERVRGAFVHDRPGVCAALLKKARLSADVSLVLSMAIVLAREFARADLDWTPGFFAETLIEVIDQRCERHTDWTDGDTLASDLVALCHTITADICQDDAREAAKPATVREEPAFAFADSGTVEDAVTIDLDADISRALAA